MTSIRAKVTLSVATVGALAVLGAACSLLWFSPGGMRSNYTVRDNDPRLMEDVRRITPIIEAIEAHQRRTGKLPARLEDIDARPAEIARLAYAPESDHYTLTVKLGWDPSLVFSSQDRSWTFDPGDGSPERRLRLHGK